MMRYMDNSTYDAYLNLEDTGDHKMAGYVGKILRVNLTTGKIAKEDISEQMKDRFLGGRGFAVKILWDEVKGVDPLSADNKIVCATGPLTGLPVPSSGKMVIATKSPLTGGYGDSNIGSRASVHLKRAGYDVLIIEGCSEHPCYLSIEDDKVQILEAKDLWGKDTFSCQDILEERHGNNSGILLIGPAGENGVRFANVMSQKGRAAGRVGIGAVMGSKNLKAIVLKGSNEIPIFDEKKLKALGKDAWADIKTKENYDIWTRQGTMMMVEWADSICALPTYNFREGTFKFAKQIDGQTAEKIRVGRQGCPNCNARCGIVVKDAEGGNAEVDYENITMLGSNIGITDLGEAAALNRLADEYGLDTISLGSNLAFLMEASEKGLIDEKLQWGDFDGCKRVIAEIVNNKGLGQIVYGGVKKAAERLGSESNDWAMQVKGMEISAYTCQSLPGMALAYGTSPIGAHHKDAFLPAWEIGDRSSYSKEKAQKVIELQRFRGGWFEALTVCRLLWVELGFELGWYPKFLKAATGLDFSAERIEELADRLYALMRAYWVREKHRWGREMDTPPARWFAEPFTQGELKGSSLDKSKYEQMLSWYYELRGWDENGVPRIKTLEKLGLEDVAEELKQNGRN
jgi:aldehyde:ferredoxin oxidoreductase